MKILQFIAKILLITLVMTVVSGLILSEPGYREAPFIGKVGYLLIMEAWAYFIAATSFAWLISSMRSLSVYQVVLLGITFGVLCSTVYLITITALGIETYKYVVAEYIVSGIRYGIVGGVMGLLYVWLFKAGASAVRQH